MEGSILPLLITTLCLGLCGKSTYADDCTPFVLTPSSLLVEYGNPAEVNCSLRSKPETRYQLGWEAKIPPESTESETSVVWKVNSLTQWEEPVGLSCYLTVGNNNQQTCKVNLTIFKRPDRVTLTSLPGVWTEGHQTELRCEIVDAGPGNRLSVRWSRTDLTQNNNFTTLNETWFTGMNNMESVNLTATLNVTATPEDDGAQYKCEAVLDLDQYGSMFFPSEPISISVHYKPIILQSSYQVTVNTGQSLTINCSAHGNPIPDYNWTLPNNTLLSSSSSSITISSVSAEHQGQYTCIATNSAGEATMTVTVTVIPFNIIPIVVGVVIGVLLVALAVAAYRIFYRPSRVGQYILKQLSSQRQNSHMNHNAENREQL